MVVYVLHNATGISVSAVDINASQNAGTRPCFYLALPLFLLSSLHGPRILACFWLDNDMSHRPVICGVMVALKQPVDLEADWARIFCAIGL